METLNDHLLCRGLDSSKYACHLDFEERITTFWLFNLSGQIVGYHHYRPEGAKSGKLQKNDPKNGRYYTHIKDAKIGVWGLERCDFDTGRYLYVTEGIFDACKLHNLGLNAIAVMSNNPKALRYWFRALNVPVTCICDGDPAGKQLAKLGTNALMLLPGTDLGDLTQEQVFDLVRNT